MEENLSHQDNSFDNQAQDQAVYDQTQVESRLSTEETEPLPTSVQFPSEESQLPPAAPDALPTAVQLPPAAPQLLPTPPSRRSSLVKALVIGLLVLLVLLTGTGAYAMERPHIPGGSASIRITPDSQQLSKTDTTTVVLGSTDPILNPIGARTVSITTTAKSLTAPATGTQQEPATYARGVVSVLDGDAAHPIPFGTYAIRSNRG